MNHTKTLLYIMWIGDETSKARFSFKNTRNFDILFKVEKAQSSVASLQVSYKSFTNGHKINIAK